MSALPGAPRQETRSALFPCLCSLLDKERHRRLCPWEAAQPDAKEFIDCVGNVWVADNLTHRVVLLLVQSKLSQRCAEEIDWSSSPWCFCHWR